jgi:hypothetical protein
MFYDLLKITCLIWIVTLWSVGGAYSQASSAPKFSIGRSECFSLSPGKFQESLGASFALSEDEHWLSAIASSGSNLKLQLYHVPTSHLWTLLIGYESEYVRTILLSINWQQFTNNGTELHIGPYIVALDAQMKNIVLTPNLHPRARREFNWRFKTLAGYSSDWNAFETSPSRELQSYEAFVQGQVRQSLIKVKSTGEILAVDYRRTVDAARMLRAMQEKEIIADLLSAYKEEYPNASPEDIGKAEEQIMQLLRSIASRQSDGDEAVSLSALVPSPDKRLLAGIAAVNGKKIGVVIPLDRGGLAAFPYAADADGSAIWSVDSSRLYYGDGTVCRLFLDKSAFGDRIAPAPIPNDKLAAPSQNELDWEKYQKVKLKHFEILSQLFEQPQVIREFKFQRAYLESGHVIILTGATYTTKEADQKFTDYTNAHYLNRPITVKISKDDFLRSYIPNSRNGTFYDTKRYNWPTEGKDWFGEVPAQLFDGSELLNNKYGQSDLAAPLEDAKSAD